MYAKIMSAAALGLLVAACGTDPQERVQGGAAAGAATGAGIGALGGPVGALAGAAIGGGAGAITGATTDARDVNLGRPVWENPETRVPGVTNTGGRAASGPARQAQQALAARGYNPGPADGVWGERSRQATMDFQRANNIEPSGRLDRQTMAALNVSATTTGAARGNVAERDRAYMGGGQVSQSQAPSPGMSDQRGMGTPNAAPMGSASNPPMTGTGPMTTPASPGVATSPSNPPNVAAGQQVPGASRGSTPGDVNTGGGSGAGASGSGGGAGR
ncbi:peptidoglycan-binding domain-containing protein [Falsiroseomonas ponticola]|uniref:peptidoglycan-binding domain-containing protein n=1 Tax=Falsiroseomonas ponticola TaxID=2786951 RepID=UPI001CF7D84B|nr:peptidoglycan-binding domain-containing protein [Roseomonas ponticola]